MPAFRGSGGRFVKAGSVGADNVQVIDRGWKKILHSLSRIGKKGQFAAVGIQGDKAAADHDGLTNAELGAIHEYGTQDGHIPERSWLRATVEEEKGRIEKRQKEAAGNVYSGKDIGNFVLLVGEEFRAQILKRVQAHIAPGLAPSTIAARNGSDTPLWDTGQLVNAITTEVREG